MISLEALSSIRGPSVRFVDDATQWPTDLQMQESGLFLAEIHGRENLTKQDFFLEIEAAFQFPYFGHNWDALNDCFRDMSWVSARGYVVRVREGAVLWRHHPDLAGGLVESALVAAEFWEDRGKPFHLGFVL